jgi:hypothetical protein
MKLWRGKYKAVIGLNVNNGKGDCKENGLQFYQRTVSEKMIGLRYKGTE